MRFLPLTLFLALAAPAAWAGGTTEFCLEGEFNLGFRMQGHRIADEWVPTSWCVITDDDSRRVLYSATGKSNTDMDGDWTVAYLPPDIVRIVNSESPPDIEFQGTNNADEALRVRRIDPRRLLEEVNDQSLPDHIVVSVVDGQLISVGMHAVLPLFGLLDLNWSWNWDDEQHPRLIITAERGSLPIFRATGAWRDIADEQAEAIWQATPGSDPIEVPGDRWPARVNMELVNLADDVYLVRGVRTGFQHLVVDTDDGLVIGDAPASWLELHQVPPANMVAGQSIDGISENFVEFLNAEFEDRPILAVVLTHFHDDHAGGAAAFAAAGAGVYAPLETGMILTEFFRERSIPNDESDIDRVPFDILPVAEQVTLGGKSNRVKLVSLGKNPHVFEMLGVWAVDGGYFFVSDVHVPGSDENAPAENRAATECWFAGWAVENLLPDVQVVNSHSPNITPVSRLAKYLESEVCL